MGPGFAAIVSQILAGRIDKCFPLRRTEGEETAGASCGSRRFTGQLMRRTPDAAKLTGRRTICMSRRASAGIPDFTAGLC